MADEIQIQVRGLRDLRNKMALLPDKVQKQVIRQSLRVGANIVKKKAQENAPVRTGNIRRGFRIMGSKIHKAPPEIGIFVVIKRKKKSKGGRNDPNDPFYARFVEDGFHVGKKTKEKRTSVRKTGKQRGRRYTRYIREKEIPGQHFLQRAYDSTKSSALQAIVADAERRIERVVKELGG
jgi:HK97 gp10 family phage protein